MDPKLFDELLATAPSSSSSQPIQPSSPNTDALPALSLEAPDPAGGAPFEMGARAQGGTPTEDTSIPAQVPYEQSLGDVSRLSSSGRVGGAIVAGGAEALFQTKDFLLGTPAEADKSETRRGLEALNRNLKQESLGYGFVSTLSQFTTGLLGAGKLIGAAKLMVPGVSGALASGAAATGRAGAIAGESAKAAAVGAVAFDPHGERLSNLINDHVPFLANPVSQYLAAKSGDTAAEGRIKNALESIGLDAAVIGTFAGTLRLYKAVRGAQAGEKGAKEELEAAVKGVVEPQERGGSTHQEASVATDPSDLRTVQNPTQGAKEAGLDGLPPRAKQVTEVSDDTVSAILSSARSDAEALQTHGSWRAALDAGHVFGRGERIPWQKMMGTVDGQPGSALDAFTGRLADAIRRETDAAKGGMEVSSVMGVPPVDVLSDARVEQMIRQRAALWGEDPQMLLGQLEAAGANARTMAVDMEAAFRVASSAMQDSFTLAQRITLGLYGEHGTKEAAVAALKEATSAAATALGAAQEMRSAAGRAMRRMRSEFQLQAADVAALKTLDGDALAKLLVATQGNPEGIRRVISPSLWRRGLDAAQFLYVNNLLWNPTTHAVNLTTNLYMVGARPLERILGSFKVGGESGQRIRAENWRQLIYLGASLHESWGTALEAWRLGDGLLSAHNTEAWGAGGGLGASAARARFRQWDSLGNVLHNVIAVAAPKAIGAPTRALGAADELVKQVVYRSKVMANAHMDGISAGLHGDDLDAFVRHKLSQAFDDAGRGTDAAALHEARVATFQQDLLPGTGEHTVQDVVNRHPALKFVLPFVRTPANVLRYGVKMTPFLNRLQEEYRQMIRGAMGPEAQAQAAGQMAMGGLFMGLSGYLAATGTITGGGPRDPKLKAALLATGWRPYSYARRHADGSTTYYDFGRFDPVGLPFGIVADLMDTAMREHEGEGLGPKAAAAAQAAALGLMQSMASKTYLRNLGQAIDAILSPDEDKSERFAGRTAAGFLPFSSGLRFINPDPYLREARSFVDQIKATVPGFSESLPPRRDIWGDPLTVNKGFWSLGDRDLVDREIVRLADEAAVTLGPPSPNVQGGVDLRDIIMKDGRNAYEVYQEYARQPSPGAKPIKDVVAGIMQGAAYQRAPDGDAQTKGTKLSIALTPIIRYREAARRRLMADENVRDAMYQKKRDVAAAYAGSKPNPTQANREAAGLAEIGRRLGVDLSGAR